MDATEFTEKQKQALIDLLVLGMYSDGHVAAVEDERIQKVLGLIDVGSEYARQKIMDASITRVRAIGGSSQSLQSFAAEAVKEFPKPELRKQVIGILGFLLDSDERVTDREREFLKTIRETFQN